MGVGRSSKIDGCSPGLSQRRVKMLLNSSRADALPNQPASLSLIFYLASSSDMSSNAQRTHRASTACQHINQAPLSPACPVCKEQSVNRIKLLLSPTSRELSAEPQNEALTANPTLHTARIRLHLEISFHSFICLYGGRRYNYAVSGSIIRVILLQHLTIICVKYDILLL